MRALVSLSLPVGAVLLGAACGELPDRSEHNPWRDAEEAAFAAYEASTIDVTGRVVGPDGAPLAGADVDLGGLPATTDRDGRFALTAVPRRNALLTVDAAGHRRWVGGVQLVLPREVATVDLPTVPVVADEPGLVRWLLGGDVALGRRFLDPDGDTPRDEMPVEDPDALIRRSTAADDSIAIVDAVKPFFDAADYRVVNLETPVTDDPSTPHRNKIFAFFTLPESLAALQHLGVQMVSLGNNHLYDYLEQGVVDTLRNVTAAGIGHAGAGSTLDEAWLPFRTEVDGVPISFLSATTVAGIGRGLPIFVAEEHKGGAADLRDGQRFVDEIQQERRSGYEVVTLLHTGNEYSREASEYARGRFELAAEGGAWLVVGHHTHTSQGFERIGDAFVIESLGNFAFDQDRLETLVSYTVLADAIDNRVERATVIPHVLDGYHTEPAVGELAEFRLRLSGEVSREPVRVMVWGDHGIVSEDASERISDTHDEQVEVTLGEDGFGYVDTRPLRREGDAVLGVTATSGGFDGVWLGQDMLQFGSFEDDDVDDDLLESSRWFWTDAALPCVGAPFRGAGALCTWRTAADHQSASVAFRNRVRVQGDADDLPNKDLTLFGRIRGDNAGEVEIYARYYASFGPKEFGEEPLVLLPAGTYGWRQVTAPLHMPDDTADAKDPWIDNARAFRIFLAQHPPADGAAQATFDDLAVVSWYLGPFEGGLLPVPRPHVADFVRVQGAKGATVRLRVTLGREVPAVAR